MRQRRAVHLIRQYAGADRYFRIIVSVPIFGIVFFAAADAVYAQQSETWPGAAMVQSADTKDDVAPGSLNTPLATVPPRVDWTDVRRAQNAGEVYSSGALAENGGQFSRTPSRFIRKIREWSPRARQTVIPVLIPAAAAAAETSSLIVRDASYHFDAFFPDGRMLGLSGRCGGVTLPDDHPIVRRIRRERKSAPRLARMNAPYRVEENERGSVLTFAKFNCTYDIVVNCPDGCDSDLRLLEAAETLGVLNAQ